MRKPPQQPKEDGIAAKAIEARNAAAAEQAGAKPEAEAPEPQEPPSDRQPEDYVEELDWSVFNAQTMIGMKTLRGDIQKLLIEDIVKHFFKDAWAKCGQSRQQEIINTTHTIAVKVVQRAVEMVNEDEAEPVEMTIVNYTGDADKLVLKITVDNDDDTLLTIKHAVGDTKGTFRPNRNKRNYMGERAPMRPDVIGSLSIPEPPLRDNLVVAGHAIKMEKDETGETKTSVASCECGWASKLPVAEVEKQGPLIKAHLEQAKAQEQVGRGPVDAQGNPVKADAGTGEVISDLVPPAAPVPTDEQAQAPA